MKGAEGSNEISDMLWLPTEREMFKDGTSVSNSYTYGPYSVTGDETEENQARLEYYADNEKRLKFFAGGEETDITSEYGNWYWEASPYAASASAFCYVSYNGYANPAVRLVWEAAPPLSVSGRTRTIFHSRPLAGREEAAASPCGGPAGAFLGSGMTGGSGGVPLRGPHRGFPWERHNEGRA